jgi:hypothetical protein
VVARGLDRYIVNGILWVLHSGARWRDLPREYGSPSTCHRRLQEWQDQGIWEHIWLTFLGALDRQGKLDWSQAFLDGSFVPAKKGERSSTYTYGVVSKTTLFDTRASSASGKVTDM